MKASKKSVFLSKMAMLFLCAKNTFRLRYYHQRHRFPNLKHPKDMSEILISSMFSDDAKRYAPLVDKVKVRDYLKEKGLESILLEHYGTWRYPHEIEFSNLPNKFILKANNGCAGHYICKDKTSLNIAEAIETLKCSINNGILSIEPHYHYISPLVFCEELIDTESEEWPTDYKFTCINGEIVDIFVAMDRRTNTHYCTLDLNWKILPYTKKAYLPNKLPEKPKYLERMIDIAKILSKDFKFVRVDLYEYKNNVFFSELTFYPWGSLLYSYTDEAIQLYGDKYYSK